MLDIMLDIMLMVLIALLSGLIGFIAGAHLMVKPKSIRYGKGHDELDYAYRLVAGQILSGEIREDEIESVLIPFLRKMGGHYSIVGDSIEFYLTPGISKNRGPGDLIDFLRMQSSEARELALLTPVKEEVVA